MTQREFSQFVAQYEKLVFTICYQFVKDYHEAQNLSQETFLSAYRHIDNYQGDNYKPWIARIATNKAKDYLNSAYSRRVTLAADEETSVETIASIRQDDPSEQPDEVYISKESSGTIEQLRLAGALRGLPDGETVLDRKSVERLWKDHVQLDKCIASLDEDGLIEILPGGGVRLPV